MKFINNIIFCILIDPFTLRFFYNLGLEVGFYTLLYINFCLYYILFIYFKLFDSISVVVLIGII